MRHLARARRDGARADAADGPQVKARPLDHEQRGDPDPCQGIDGRVLVGDPELRCDDDPDRHEAESRSAPALWTALSRSHPPARAGPSPRCPRGRRIRPAAARGIGRLQHLRGAGRLCHSRGVNQSTAEAAGGRALVGYDGSPPSANAIEIAARLLPALRAVVVYVWSAPFASAELRRRLVRRATSLEELAALIEREGAAEAERVAAAGADLARRAGWDAEPLVRRAFGGEGIELARLAEELRPAVVVVGARGLRGVRALLGSISDIVVHHSPVPVLVVPDRLDSDARNAVASGPVVVGDDGSAGAGDAHAAEAAGADLAAAPHAERLSLDPPGPAERPAAGVARRLARLASERGAAAIVVGSRGRSAARKVLLGSVAMAALHHAARPVLVVPRPGGRPPG
jgi:nucleotide-binding universal stress UspA family protein